jgi:hypothetical protein
MDNSHVNNARWSLRCAPWAFAVSIVTASGICFWVIAPFRYLLWSVAIGVAWFILTVLYWRTRSGALHFITLLFVIFGHQILRERLLARQLFPAIQGLFVSIAVYAVLLWLFRRPLARFARLEKPHDA